MTNQQKIEFYLSKGFAVEVEWDDKEKAKIYHIALPEDEEYEVVEVIDDGIFVRENGVFTFTKPDGKKLKIRVIKQ